VPRLKIIARDLVFRDRLASEHVSVERCVHRMRRVGRARKLKLDGYRLQARGARGVRLFTRRGLDWTYRKSGIVGTFKTIAGRPYLGVK
jgi:ATP-dependent DNA ligase